MTFKTSNRPTPGQYLQNEELVQAAWLAKFARDRGVRANELPEQIELESTRQWRDAFPDAEAVVARYPFPQGYLAGSRFGSGIRHSQDAAGGLAAYEKRLGKKATAVDRDAFRAASQPLVDAALESSRIFDPVLLDLVGDRGSEHSVTFTPGRVLKITDPDSDGGAVYITSEGEPEVRRALLPDYLRQIELNSELLASDQRVEGVMIHPDGAISIVTSQPALVGVAPTPAELSDALRASGFKPAKTEAEIGFAPGEYRVWWNKERNIAIADVKYENFVKIDDGTILDIDS